MLDSTVGRQRRPSSKPVPGHYDELAGVHQGAESGWLGVPVAHFQQEHLNYKLKKTCAAGPESPDLNDRIVSR